MKAKPKRVTVYVDPDLHMALRLKAAETERPYSALVNEALRQSLAEDAGDLAAIVARAKEPSMLDDEDRVVMVSVVAHRRDAYR